MGGTGVKREEPSYRLLGGGKRRWGAGQVEKEEEREVETVSMVSKKGRNREKLF